MRSAVTDFRDLAPLWSAQRLLIGALTTPWPGDIWAQEIGDRYPDTSAHTFTYRGDSSDEPELIPCDLVLDGTDDAVMAAFGNFALRNYTHVLLDPADPLVAVMTGSPGSGAIVTTTAEWGAWEATEGTPGQEVFAALDAMLTTGGAPPLAVSEEDHGELDAPRGRIVMLVDNDVVRDSRVQKQARSTAERGWDVILLGITRKKTTKQRLRWQIGEARVQLLYKSTALKPARRRRTSAPLTSVLAYRTKAAEEYAQLRVEARRRSLEHDRALRDLDGSTSTPGMAGHPATLAARRGAFWIRRKAVAARLGASERLKRTDEEGSVTSRWTTAVWQRALGDRSWSELDPSLAEWDLVFGDTIDRLKPDIIHANDFRMLGVGARAKVRAHQRGHHVSLVWDAHEYLPGLTERPTREDLALYAFEREHIPFADRVITVSDTLADMLMRDHDLATRPYVVENAPVVTPPVDSRWLGEASPDESVRVLRQDCNLDDDTPLLVYCGVAIAERGLETIVRGLAGLPGVHAAFVVSDVALPFVVEMRDLASRLGVVDRLHIVTYVPVDHIVPYLSGADIGVVAAHHVPNNEISLPTKFREYAHARLPLVVSDVRTVAGVVTEHGLGEVFVAGDVDSFVNAVRTVLADKQSYRWRLNAPGLLTGWSWEAAAEVLDSVYASLESKDSRSGV